MKLLIEALFVGISTILMYLLLHVLLGYHAQHAQSPTMKKEMINLCILSFLTGVLLHFMFEFIGLNAWYCKNGNACAK